MCCGRVKEYPSAYEPAASLLPEAGGKLSRSRTKNKKPLPAGSLPSRVLLVTAKNRQQRVPSLLKLRLPRFSWNKARCQSYLKL